MYRPFPHARGAESSGATGYRSVTLSGVPRSGLLGTLEVGFSADPGTVIVALAHDGDGDALLTDAVEVTTVQAINSKYSIAVNLHRRPFRYDTDLNTESQLFLQISTGNSVIVTGRLYIEAVN